jgi:hypothetical protein
VSLKLGKQPFEHDPKDFKAKLLFEAVAPEMPTPPDRFGHGLSFKDWLMLGNGPDDTVQKGFGGAGDCVFAGGGHETMLTTKLGGHPATFTGANSIEDYSAVTGYVIGDDSTDNGTEPRVAAKYRRDTGLIDAAGKRHKIAAFVSIDPSDFEELVQCVYVFTAVGIGFEFPDTAWNQFSHHLPWDVVDGAAIEGGHYVPVVGRNAKSTIGVISWGRRVGMTRDFYEAYSDEAWAYIFPEELRNGKTYRGYDLSQLRAWLDSLK